MRRDPAIPRLVHCRYRPTEPGLYSVDVRWRDRPVPGSPFAVPVCDTEDELGRAVGAANTRERRLEHLRRVNHTYPLGSQVRRSQVGDLS